METENILLRLKDGGIDVYMPLLVLHHANQLNCWTHLHIDLSVEKLGEICTVKLVALGIWKVCSKVSDYVPPPLPQTLSEVLMTWGNTWMWNDLCWRGEADT